MKGSNWSQRTRAISPHALLFLPIFPCPGHFVPEQSHLMRHRVTIFFTQPPTPQGSTPFSPSQWDISVTAVPTVEVEKGMGQDRAPESRDLEPPDDGNSYEMCCSLVTFTFLPGCSQQQQREQRPAEVGRGHPCSDPCRQDSLRPCHHFCSFTEPGEVTGLAPCLTLCCAAVIPCLSTAVST